LPRKYSRGDDPAEVYRHPDGFLKANRETIHAMRLLST
jgi:hypothetical protein